MLQQNYTQYATFSHLPIELKSYIFTFLNTHDDLSYTTLCTIRRVCKQWNILSRKFLTRTDICKLNEFVHHQRISIVTTLLERIEARKLVAELMSYDKLSESFDFTKTILVEVYSYFNSSKERTCSVHMRCWIVRFLSDCNYLQLLISDPRSKISKNTMKDFDLLLRVIPQIQHRRRSEVHFNIKTILYSIRNHLIYVYINQTRMKWRTLLRMSQCNEEQNSKE